MRLPSALAAAVSAVVGLTSPAWADAATPVEEAPRAHRRIVLVSMPDSVFAATASALGPWSIAVEATTEPPPADELAAATMARAHGATAVAWLEGSELVIYDDFSRRIERRSVPETPAGIDGLDEVGAATIALSIKTSLRRPVQVAAAPPPPPPERPPVEVFAAPPEVVAEVVPVRAPRPRLHAAARLGAGLPLASPSPTMPRVGARISHDLPGEPRLAVLAGVEVGPSAEIDHPELTGRYRDVAFAVGAEWRQPLAGRWWLVPSLAGTVHLTRLEGTILMPNPRDTVESAHPFGAEVEVAIETGGRLRGGVAVHGSFLTGRDRYKVRGEDVLVVPAATLGATLRISFQ